MKPTKNKVFCYAVKRTKMLFESESKADNFIKYNTEEILKTSKKAPVRSYFCQFCMGWHVTSNPNVEVGAELDQKEKVVMENIHSVAKAKAERRAKTKISMQEILEAEKKIMQLDIPETERLFAVIDFSLSRSKKVDTKFMEKYNEVLCLYNELKKMETDDEYLPKIPSKYMFLAENYKIKKELDSMLPQLRKYAEEGNVNFEEYVKTFLILIRRMSGAYHSVVSENYTKAAHDLQITYMGNCRQTESGSTMDMIQRRSKTYVRKDLYKKTLLDVISKIESLEADFKVGDFQKCERTIDLCEILLDELQYNDSSTEMLRNHLNHWVDRLTEQSA